MGFRVVDADSYARSRDSHILLPNGQREVKEEWDYESEPEETFDADFVYQRTKDLISIQPSIFTEFAIRMPDKEKQTFEAFSFRGRRYMRQIYDTPSRRRLLLCGRQVEKSTCLGNSLLSYACIVTSLNALYVSPTNQQSKVFSQDRLKEPIETSPYLKSWTTTKLSDNVFLKKFINRSQITLRYAYLNADRVRGIPADVICIDELQDLLTDNIPVIEECASHSHLKIFIYSGTPKSLDNTIQYYWANYSTQNEWAVPCHRHAIRGPLGLLTRVHWNILGEEHIGAKSLVCDRCSKPINPQDEMSNWVAMNPEIMRTIPKPYEGFRIPQIMVPWVSHDDILQKQKTYSRSKFYNEVLGLSYDAGTRPLTQKDIIDNCVPSLSLDSEYQQKLLARFGDGVPIYAGIDWGAGTESSYTVFCVGAYIEGKFTIFYIHRFEGPEMEPQVQLDRIMKFIDRWRPRKIACDYGGGYWPNDELTRKFGWQRVMKYQYSTPGDKVRWDQGMKRYLVHRSEIMSDIFNAIKRRNVFAFPKWEHFKSPFGDDMLNIFSEYSETRRISEFKKSPSATDDSFHAILLCFLGSMVEQWRPDVIQPMAHSNEIVD